MKTVLLWYFWLGLAGVGARLLMLSYSTYPRIVTWSRGEDALTIVFSAAALVWIASVIWFA